MDDTRLTTSALLSAESVCFEDVPAEIMALLDAKPPGVYYAGLYIHGPFVDFAEFRRLGELVASDVANEEEQALFHEYGAINGARSFVGRIDTKTRTAARVFPASPYKFIPSRYAFWNWGHGDVEMCVSLGAAILTQARVRMHTPTRAARKLAAFFAHCDKLWALPYENVVRIDATDNLERTLRTAFTLGLPVDHILADVVREMQGLTTRAP